MNKINKVYPLIVDLVKPTYPVRNNIIFNEADSKSAFIDIEIRNNDKVVDISDVEILINAIRRDGESIQVLVDKTEPKKGKCRFNLTKSMLEESGLLKFQISLYHGDSVSVTQTIFVKVEPALIGQLNIEEDKNYDVLTKLIKDVENVNRVASENIGKTRGVVNEFNSIKKQYAESEKLRDSNEKQRESNEKIRKQAESSRTSQQSERIKALNQEINNIPNRVSSTLQEQVSNAFKKVKEEISSSVDSAKKGLSSQIESEIAESKRKYASEFDGFKKNTNQEISKTISSLESKITNRLAQIPPNEKLKGQKGEKGDSIIFKGVVNNKQDLPSNDPNNSAYYVKNGDDSGLYIKASNGNWTYINKLDASSTGSSAQKSYVDEQLKQIRREIANKSSLVKGNKVLTDKNWVLVAFEMKSTTEHKEKNGDYKSILNQVVTSYLPYIESITGKHYTTSNDFLTSIDSFIYIENSKLSEIQNQVRTFLGL